MSTATDRVQDTLTLRLFTEENITDEYLNWFKDEEFTRYLDAKNITKEQAIEHWQTCRRDGSFFYAIYADDTHVGNIKLSANYDLSIVVFPPYWGRGYVAVAIETLCNAAGVDKITAGVRSGNIGSLKAFKSVGFVETGIQQDDILLCK